VRATSRQGQGSEEKCEAPEHQARGPVGVHERAALTECPDRGNRRNDHQHDD
jgi:hypothetical protein